jgi:hypothetical protein
VDLNRSKQIYMILIKFFACMKITILSKIKFFLLKNCCNDNSRVSFSFFAFLIILPIILDIIYIRYYGVNVPYMDEWGFVPIIDKFYNNNISFIDIFAQNNEHREIFARIIMLIAMYFTHYNIVAEMYISCGITSLSLFILFILYKQRFGLSLTSLIGFIPISWLLFDYRQFENILMGWTIHIYLAVFGLILSIFSLKNTRKIDRMFILAIIGGTLSSFSFLTGLVIWPLGFLLIIASKANKIFLGALWSLAGIVISYIYFYNWVKPGQTPSILYSIENPLEGIAYMFVYVGSFFIIEIHSILVSFVFGILIVLAAIISIGLIIKNDLLEETLEWIALIGFSFASAVITTIGRAGFGLGQALSSRYVTFSLLAIIGLYSITLKLSGIKNINYKILYRTILCFIVLGLVFGYSSGIFAGEKISESREKMAFSVLHFTNASDESLSYAYPDPRFVRECATILEKYRLNVFYDNSLRDENA